MGTEPSSSTASWKARTLKRAPSARSALLRPLQNRVLTQIIGERLRRPGDIAVDLGLDFMLRQRRVLPQIIERLLAAPALRMNAGVDDQPRRPPDLIVEHAEPVVRRLVHAHLLTQPLAIKRPAFAVGREVGVLAELRLVLVLERQRYLEGVARCGLVQGERGQVVQRPARQVVGIEQVEARAAAARRVEGRQIVGHRLDG